MSDLYWLSDAQMERPRPYFPKSHGRPRVDDKPVLSGIIFINRDGLRWRDAPADYGPDKTLYNRWTRCSRMGVFARVMEGLAARAGRLPVHHDRRDLSEGPSYGLEPAGSKGGRGHLMGRTRGGMNTKLHAVPDREGRPVRLFVSAGHVSDDKGALAHQSQLLRADWLIADRGYDADWFRNALSDSKIRVCIPPRKSRTIPIKYDKRRYRRRHRIEIMFGRIKDWRRVATRYDRCQKVFLSAIALAATVIYWLCVLSLATLYLANLLERCCRRSGWVGNAWHEALARLTKYAAKCRKCSAGDTTLRTVSGRERHRGASQVRH